MLEEIAVVEMTVVGLVQTSGNYITVTCEVCEAAIAIDKNNCENLVKCQKCGMLTAVRPAPKGMKYIRCECKHLFRKEELKTFAYCPKSNCNFCLAIDGTRVIRA